MISRRCSPGYSANDRLRRPPNDPEPTFSSGGGLTPGRPDGNNNKNYMKANPEEADCLGLPDCTCNRPVKRVICRFCGFYVEGRVRRTCERHPKYIYFSDFAACPGCGVAHHLQEFEFPAAAKPNN